MYQKAAWQHLEQRRMRKTSAYRRQHAHISDKNNEARGVRA